MTETRRFAPAAGPGPAADLARLAFASATDAARDHSLTPRHLAFLPPDALDLDLTDPAQRDFGPYELLEKIGQGGMGVVYRARQKSLDREVALKLLAAGPWASPEFVELFRREAKSAARMEHPNIVAIYETGDSDELNYFSMRLVRGRSLAARLREAGPYPPVAAARLMRTVAEAVDYAHSLGILHLDLKPGNVLLDENGTPLVADFGLARRLDHALADTPYEIAGTPSYMSPEQVEARGSDIGVATDIYGLGAILYEVLCGRPPFIGDTPQQTLQRVLAADAAPLDDAPRDLEAICRCCLAKRPADRYGSARQLADDLQRFLEDREVSVRPQSPWERSRRWARRDPRTALAAAAVLATLVVGIAATASQWRRAENNAEASRELLWEGRIESAMQSERDGDGVAALAPLLANAAERDAAGDASAAARDRRRLGVLVGEGARLLDQVAITDANPLAAEISPDGRLLAMAMNDLSIRWYDTATLAERGRVSLADREPSDGQRRPVLLLHFVDAHRLLATMEWYSNFTSPGGGDTWLVDTEHGRVVAPPPAFADFADACYAADGRHALLRDHQHRAQWWQVEPWRPLSALGAQMPGFMPCLLDPGGGFAAFLGVGMRDLFVYPLPALGKPISLTLPEDAGASAWRLSHDGGTLALGDFEGRVFAFDTRTWALRRLATTRGREVTWLAFSEDDRWIAIAGFDGVVRVLAADTGDPVASGQLEHDFPVQRLGLSRARHLLVAAGEGRVALWRLPVAGPRAVRAERIGLAPAPHALAARYPVGWSLDTGLLATAGIDGQVRLWRLPRAPMRDATAARQISEALRFDGQRLVDVDGPWLRLVDTQDHALTPWHLLDEPPGFAEALPGTHRIGITVGNQLMWRDDASLKPLGVPTPLPATPMHWLASEDGRRLLLGFGGSDGRSFVETLRLYDATSGRALPGEAALPGPIRHLAMSHDGQWLLAVGPANAATTVFRLEGLHRAAEYDHDPDAPVVWADFDARDQVWMVTRAGDARAGDDQLVHWEPATDKVAISRVSGGPVGLTAWQNGVFVAAQDHDVWHRDDGREVTTAHAGIDEALAVTAVSEHARLLAHAFRRSVRLLDLDSGERIGLPLPSGSNAMDLIVQLAFDADGTRLVGRTVQGHWLSWQVAAEPPGGSAMTRALVRLHRAPENQQAVTAPDPDERRRLRRDDAGPWPTPESRPQVTQASHARTGVAIPERTQPLPPALLDLAPDYNIGPEELRNSYYNVRPQMRPIPIGVQWLAGVAFDVRGMMQTDTLRNPGDPAGRADSIRCQAIPPRVRGMHALLGVSLPTPLLTDTPIAVLTWHFRDGGQASLPLRAGRELPGFAGNDAAVPWAFGGDVALTLQGLDDAGTALVAPWLPNPEPARPVACFDLVRLDDERPLLVFAITVEPGGGRP